MTSDIYLVTGLIILVCSVPVIVGAFRGGRPPRMSAVLALVGGALVVAALAQKPEGYRLEEIPMAFDRVVNWIAIYFAS